MAHRYVKRYKVPVGYKLVGYTALEDRFGYEQLSRKSARMVGTLPRPKSAPVEQPAKDED